jgi:hypothetical protein
VSYGNQGQAYSVEVDVGNRTSLSLTLSNPGTYYFSVRAYNVLGLMSAASSEVSTVISGTTGGSPQPVPQPPPSASRPEVSIDRPGNAAVLPSDLLVAGWAIDSAATTGTGIDMLHVYAYPNPGSGAQPLFLGLASYGIPRPDVAAVMGAQFENSGYTLPIVGLPPANYRIAVYAHSTVANAFNCVRMVDVRIFPPSAPPPFTGPGVAVQLPLTGQTLTGYVSVGGWAIDMRSTNGPGIDAIQVWAYPAPGSGTLPIFLGNAQTGITRDDVAAMFGARFQSSGYYLDVAGLVDGVYDIVILARSSVSLAWEVARVSRVTVRPSVLIDFDGPQNGATVSTNFSLSGWSVDRRATANAGVDMVHVWAFPNPGSGAAPIFVGVAPVQNTRTDLGAILGANFTNSGFHLQATLPPGEYGLVAFGHSMVSNGYDNAKLIRIHVR